MCESKTGNGTAQYRCLRNYYNQRIHDLLDRNAAKAFLSHWLGEPSVVEIEDEVTDIAGCMNNKDEIIVMLTDSY